MQQYLSYHTQYVPENYQQPDSETQLTLDLPGPYRYPHKGHQKPFYVDILSDDPYGEVGMYAPLEIAAMVNEALDKLSTEQRQQITPYLVFPSHESEWTRAHERFSDMLTEFEKGVRPLVDHSFYSIFIAEGHVVAVRFNPVKKTATIFDSGPQAPPGTTYPFDNVLKKVFIREHGYQLKIREDSAQIMEEDVGCAVYTALNLIDLMKKKQRRIKPSQKFVDKYKAMRMKYYNEKHSMGQGHNKLDWVTLEHPMLYEGETLRNNPYFDMNNPHPVGAYWG